MNELQPDSELQQILKEARENYQKRIQFLKNSMQGIAKELPSDRYSITERNDYTQKTCKTTDSQLLESLSKIQVLEIENQNLKSILHKENYRTPPRDPHKRNFSGSSEGSVEVSRVRDILKLCEHENKELRAMNLTLKENSKDLENRDLENKAKIEKLDAELETFYKNSQNLQESLNKSRLELEKVKKDKNVLAAKARELEVRNQGLCAELESVQMERNRLKIRETPNVNFSKCREKARKYKEKFLELQEKVDKNEELHRNHEEIVKKLSFELREKQGIIEEKEFFIKEIQTLTSSLKQDLNFCQSSLKQSQDSLNQLKASSSQTIKSLTQSQSELVAQYESKIQQLQQESSEKVSKTAEDILSQLDQIEVDYKAKLEEIIQKLGSSNEKVQSLTSTLSDLTEQNSLLQSSYQELSKKYLKLEEDFQAKQEEFQMIYNQEVSQHKADVLALESEVQKLYSHQSSTDVDVLNEKYKILKAEYFEVQQQLHLNKSVFEQQLEDYKRKFLSQDQDDETSKARISSLAQDLQRTESRVDELLTENRRNQEEKTKTRGDLESCLQSLQLERRKTSQIKELVKISLKQMKNEFFQSLKLAHRGIFEELLVCKKFLSENASVIHSKLTACLNSWSAQVESTLMNKKQLHEWYLRDCEGLNEIRLQVSQLERELRIKDDRIFYLESSLKSSLSRPRPEQDVLRVVLQQVSLLEANFSESLKELVDLVVHLKSFISKEHMEVLQDLEERLSHKDSLLKQVRTELIRSLRASS